MLSLQAPDWSDLQHAYGSASDIPDFLRSLEGYPEKSDPNSEPFFSLWSALCHQGDAYTASYAAVPHLVRLATACPEKTLPDHLLLPTAIEIARLTGRGPALPVSIAGDYIAAIKEIPGVVGRIPSSRLREETWALTCAAAIAVTGGHATISEAILELEGGTAKDFLEWSQTR